MPSWKNKLKEKKNPEKAKRKQNPNSKRLWFLSTTFSWGQQPKRAQNTQLSECLGIDISFS